MSLILGVPMSDIEKVIYFAGHIITAVDEEKRKEILAKVEKEFKEKVDTLEDEDDIDKLKGIFKKVRSEINGIVKGAVVDELNFSKYSQKYEGLFQAEIGAEAIYNLIKKVDLKKLLKSLEKTLAEGAGLNKAKVIKRISLIKSLLSSGVKPE